MSEIKDNITDDMGFMRSHWILLMMSEIHMGGTTKEIARANRIRLVCENITDEEFGTYIYHEKDQDKVRKYINEKFAEITGNEVDDYVY